MDGKNAGVSISFLFIEIFKVLEYSTHVKDPCPNNIMFCIKVYVSLILSLVFRLYQRISEQISIEENTKTMENSG